METWKILIILFVAAIAAGCLAGIIVGKYMVKRAKSNHKPLLSGKEKIIYSSCLLLGIASILFGVFFSFPSFPTADGMGRNREEIPAAAEGVPDANINGEPGIAEGEANVDVTAAENDAVEAIADEAKPVGADEPEPATAVAKVTDSIAVASRA